MLEYKIFGIYSYNINIFRWNLIKMQIIFMQTIFSHQMMVKAKIYVLMSVPKLQLSGRVQDQVSRIGLQLTLR